MKSIIESLNELADKIDTSGASDVKPDYKNPNYSIETALKRIADNYSAGSGGGFTVYPIKYDEETYDAYVEVTDSELIEKAKNGLVLFINGENELSCGTYIVGGVDESGAYTLYPQSASQMYHKWTYTNGKYVLDND